MVMDWVFFDFLHFDFYEDLYAKRPSFMFLCVVPINSSTHASADVNTGV